MGILDYFFDRRTEEQKFVVGFAEDVYDALSAHANDIAAVVEKESKRRGIDPRYVMHRLVFDTKSWWSKVRRQDQDALFLAVDLYSQVGRNAINISRYDAPGPDMEPVVATVFQAVAKWASKTWLRQLGASYRDVLKSQVNVAQRLVLDKSGEDLTYAEAFYWIHGKLHDAVQKHVYGIPHRNFLGSVLDLMSA